MKVPKFFININYFTKDDLKSFEKFLLSPLLNTMNAQILVFRIIKRNIVLIRNNNYEELKSLIITESKYNRATVRKVLSKLNDMYVEYSKLHAYKKDKFQGEYLLCDYLLLKGNYDLLNKRVVCLKKMLSDPVYFDHDIFLKMYELNKLEYNILSTSEEKHNPLIKMNDRKRLTLEAPKNLLVYTISKTTIDYVNYTLQCSYNNDIKNKAYPVNLDSLFSVIKTPEYKFYSVFQKATIEIYFLIYKLFKNPTTDVLYHEYNSYYSKVCNLFNVDFRKTQLSIIMNYCSLRQRIEDKERYYSKEGLRLLYEYIDKCYYVNDKTTYLHTVIYRNFVAYCLNIEQKDILENFIQKHTKKLHPSEFERMRNYALSHYYYLDKNYDLALDYSMSLDIPKFVFKYDVSNLLIKLYYELGHFDNLECLLHNYIGYIKNDNTLTKNEKGRIEFFIKSTDKFIKEQRKYFITKDIFNFEFLLNKINNNESFAMKNWITEKVINFIKIHYQKNAGKAAHLKIRKSHKGTLSV